MSLAVCICQVCVSAFCIKICSHVAKIWKKITYGIWNFQSNSASLVLLLLDLDLNFQGQSFGTFLVLWISRKRWEIEQTLLLPSDRKLDICHWMVPLQMLYIMTLTYIIKVTYLIVNVSIYQRILQTTVDNRKFQWIFNLVCGGQYKFIFPQKFCFFFHLFQVEWETHIVSFLANSSTNSRFFFSFMIKVLEVHKMYGTSGGCRTT